jgi:nucleotide-binding universal stress UspA family protein
MSYKRILVPVDGSPTSARGLAEAIKLARDARAKLLLLHVVEEYAILGVPDAGANIGPMLDALKRAGRKTLSRIERSAQRLGVRSETMLVEDFSGRVANAIVDRERTDAAASTAYCLAAMPNSWSATARFRCCWYPRAAGNKARRRGAQASFFFGAPCADLVVAPGSAAAPKPPVVNPSSCCEAFSISR